MEFRRSGGRDERRRRVLMEETTSADTASGEATGAPGSDPAKRVAADYSSAAEASRQLRISDLVPRSGWLVSLLALAATLVASGIVAAAWYSPRWVWLDDTTQSIFAADARGNLASWFACLIMLLCAVGAIQIYLLRRHKVNDYRGRYRLWIWIAALFLLSSADAIVGLHDLLAVGLKSLLPETWSIGMPVLTLAPVAVMIVAVGMRLAIEVRQSYGTLSTLALCGICYLLSVVSVAQPSVMQQLGATDSHAVAVIGLACHLGGHAALLLVVMLFARYVHLAANGMLKVRPPRQRREKKAKVARVDKESAESGASKSQPATAKRKKAKAIPAKQEAEKPQPTRAKSSSDDAADADEDAAPDTLSLEELAERSDLSESDTAHLSKAERRRLRKLQRRSNRAA